MPVNKDAVKFFTKHAGFATPPGRMVCAKALAESEALADQLGLQVEWEYDHDPDTSWMSRDELAKVMRGEWAIMQAWVRGLSGEVLASLGGIVLAHDTDNHYQRVVEAELKAEAVAALKQGF